MMDLSVVPYEAAKPEAVGASGADVTAARYRECMRNHAASIGGQAFDGCGEFMPSGDSLLKCAACGCHRNFHRRDGLFAGVRHPLLLPPPAYFPPPAAFRMPPPQAAMAPPAAMERGRLGSETPPRADGGEGSRKRIRTKFTAEQKEKMQAFAEKLGWRIQKHDDVALEEFCVEIGVKRHVLKVWMHNNKNHLSSSSASAAAAAGGNANGGGKTEPAAISV